MNINPPVYLGVSVEKDETPTWCFIAIKDGVGRFVRYINYPLWSRGSDMPDKLNIKTQPPVNILEDVSLFIEGKIAFHELPPKRGRRRRVIRTLLGDVCGGGSNPGEPGGSSSPGQSLPQRERRTDRSGPNRLPDETVRVRKKRKVRGPELRSRDISESDRTIAFKVAKKLATKAVPVLPTELEKGVEVVRKKRGRPKGIK